MTSKYFDLEVRVLKEKIAFDPASIYPHLIWPESR